MTPNSKTEKNILKNYPLRPGEIIFAVVFGLIYSLAWQLQRFGEMNISPKQVIPAALVCYVALHLVRFLMDRSECKAEGREWRCGVGTWVKIWIAGMAVDFLCLLVYFPGVGMNDGLNILNFGMSQSGQFPVFYCAVLMVLERVGARFGTLQISVALYSVLQVVIVSAICAGIVVWFLKKNAPRWLKWVVIVYFVAEPLLSMYAISMLRDTIFSLFLLILILILYDLLIEKKETVSKWYWIGAVITLAGILWLRSNGIYIVFPTLILLLIFCSKHRKAVLVLLILSVGMVLLDRAATAYFGQAQLFQEMVGIPLQQMAAVVANGGDMTEEQRAFMDQLMPLEEIAARYDPSTVDVIKWNHELFNSDFLESHRREFLLTWIQMLPHNLGIYIKAYLQQTFWFWAPYQEGTVQCFYTIETVADNQWLIDFLAGSGIHDQPLLPEAVNQIFRSWFSLGKYFLREGVCFWVTLGTMFLHISKSKNWKYLCVYVPILLLWLTLMISTPVAQSIRYMFVLVYGLPIFIGLLFVKPTASD